MAETKAYVAPPAILTMSAGSVARKVGRAMLEFARDYSRAQQAAALAEADRKHLAGVRTLYLNDPVMLHLNDPVEPSPPPPDTKSDANP